MTPVACDHVHQLADILRRQHFVVGRDQALACGLTLAALEHRIRPGGPWQRLLPGVYLAVTGPPRYEHREIAALLHSGPESVLTGMAALRRHGLRVPSQHYRIDVLVPARNRRHSVEYVRIQRSTRMPGQVCVADEVRYVLPARAVADAARGLNSAREVRDLVAQAIQQQRCSIGLLAKELEEGPTRGSALLRAALAEARAGIRSAPEGDLRILLRRGRIPMPMLNARLYDGNSLIGVPDAWWPDAGVAVEVDSREYHYPASNWQHTMRRHDRLVARGILLLHFTPQQIRSRPAEVISQIRAALEAGRQRPRLPIVARPAA